MFRNTQKVYYKSGTQPPRKAMVKHPYKIHAWGAFSVKGPIGFFLFTDIMDGALYRKILTENLFENANKIMGKNWVFQQYNNLSTQLKNKETSCKEMAETIRLYIFEVHKRYLF